MFNIGPEKMIGWMPVGTVTAIYRGVSQSICHVKENLSVHTQYLSSNLRMLYSQYRRIEITLLTEGRNDHSQLSEKVLMSGFVGF